MTETENSTGLQLDAHDSNNLGFEERRMLLQLTGPQPRLCYPVKKLSMLNNSVVEQYIIPDTDRKKVLESLYPFEHKPDMDSQMLDIHAGRTFKVKDFMVIREGDGNFLVSPYYAQAGGTVLDWMPADDKTSCLLQNEEQPEANSNGELLVMVEVVKFNL